MEGAVREDGALAEERPQESRLGVTNIFVLGASR